MPQEDFRKGDVIRRNRKPGEIDKITMTSVHIKLLTDFTFRVHSSEIIPIEKASVTLRKAPKDCYTWTLVKHPDKFEKMCSDEIASIMALLLRECVSPFGKREFKQILLEDDQIVPPDKWNSFWNRAYKAMREDPRFTVDEHGRYCLVEGE